MNNENWELRIGDEVHYSRPYGKWPRIHRGTVKDLMPKTVLVEFTEGITKWVKRTNVTHVPERLMAP